MEFGKRIFLVFILITVASSQDLSSLNLKTLRVICSRGLPLTVRGLELKCCYVYKELFRHYWYTGGRYFFDYLELLRTWRCPQLEQECQDRPYRFTEFNQLAYDRFCNRTALEEKCSQTLIDVIGDSIGDAVTTGSLTSSKNQTTYETSGKNEGNNLTYASKWNQLVHNLDVTALHTKDLVKPCVQIAQMDAPAGGFGDYQETIVANNPFCSIVWCGFSRSAVKREGGIRPFDCMPTLCQANMIVMMVVIILLAVTIAVANLFVIFVFGKTKKLQNSQAVYKISLAAADFVVGAFVLPTFAVNLAKRNLQPIEVGGTYKLRMANLSNQFVNWTQVPMPGRDGVTVHLSTGYFSQVFDDAYKNAAGSITTISIVVSVISLTLAGVDRLFAVLMPLRYRRFNSKKIAVRLIVATWIIAVILSLLPLMTPNLKYALLSTVMFAMYGSDAYIVYVTVLLVPLVAVWTTSIAVYAVVIKQTKKRKKIAVGSVNRANENETEHRLAITLTIIVGVLTLSAVPTTIMAVISLTVQYQLDPSKPFEFNSTKNSVINSADFIAGMILMCNSLWNYFIYSARNKDFRKASKSLWRITKQKIKGSKERSKNDTQHRSGMAHINSSSGTPSQNKGHLSSTAGGTKSTSLSKALPRV